MPERTTPRHPSFDYRSTAAYFVTICTYNRLHLFGEVRDGRMDLSRPGEIVVTEWYRSEDMREEVVLDAFVLMPNHLHGIVCLVPPGVDAVSPHGYRLSVGPDPTSSDTTSMVDAGPPGDTALRNPADHPRWEDGRPQRHSGSLGSMIAGFKGTTTRQINEHRGTPRASVWQPRYHDRILRNESEWRACRRYVEQNPGRWAAERSHSSG